MSDPTLDPDLEQVLEDIATDPRSKLFLTDPRKVLTGLRDGSLETPASRTGLRPAERHLLEVYRHELAFLLRQVYRVELAKRDTVHVQLTTPSDSVILSRISRLLRTREARTHEEGLLRSFYHGTGVNFMRVLGSSLAIKDAPETSVCLANEYIDRQAVQSARRLFAQVLSRPQNPMIQYCAWEGLGFVHDELGDTQRSMDAYMRARSASLTISPSDALASTTNVLRLALTLDSRSHAVDTAKWIDRNFNASSPALTKNTLALRIAFKNGSDIKNPELLHFLLDSSESSALEVIHAIAG